MDANVAQDALELIRELVDKLGITAEQALPHVAAHIQAEATVEFWVHVLSGVLMTALWCGFLFFGVCVERRLQAKVRGSSDSGMPMFIYGLIASFGTWGATALISRFFVAAGEAYAAMVSPIGALVRGLLGV